MAGVEPGAQSQPINLAVGEPRQSGARSRVEQRWQLELRISAAALAGLVGAAARQGALPEWLLMSVAPVVAESLGLDVHTPVSPNPREHPVAAIADASGFPTRRVLLVRDWWHRDNGPLWRTGSQTNHRWR